MDDKELQQTVIEYLILAGAVEVAGLDSETGEPLYNFTPKLKEIDPEMYQEIQDYFNAGIMLLWELGFVEFDPTENDPLVTLTEKAHDKKEIAKLAKHEQQTLESIKMSFKRLG